MAAKINSKDFAPEPPAAAQYKLLTAVDFLPMEQRINEAIGEGFLPVGNLTKCGNMLTQGMLKPAK